MLYSLLLEDTFASRSSFIDVTRDSGCNYAYDLYSFLLQWYFNREIMLKSLW